MVGTEAQGGPGAHPLLTPMHARRTTDYLAFLLPHLRPGMDVLDCGCGPGSISIGVAALVAPGRLEGIDLDAERVAQATARAAEQDVTNAAFRRGDIYALPFEDARFDAAYASHVLEHLPDPVAALREVHRVLRPGGVVGVCSPDNGGIVFWPPDPHVERWLASHETIRRHDGADNLVGRRLRRVLLDAGFACAEASASMTTYGTAEECRGFVAVMTSLFAERWRRQYIELELADDAAVTALVEGLTAWSERPDAFFATPRCEAVGWVG